MSKESEDRITKHQIDIANVSLKHAVAHVILTKDRQMAADIDAMLRKHEKELATAFQWQRIKNVAK